MDLWSDASPTSQSHPDSDIAVVYAGAGPAGQPLPPTKFIIVSAPLGTSYHDPSQAYDWSRVVAVEIDEPYNDTRVDDDLRYPDGTFACQPPALGADMAPVDVNLQARAQDLKVLAPNARFWVNFTDNEATWMAQCLNPTAFNKDYIDVVSADWSADRGNNNIASAQPFLSLLAANPPQHNPSQQLALIPGVNSGPVDPNTQVQHLQGFFDYANQTNQAHGCNLPFGQRGVTGIFDGCPVWAVLGWLSGTVPAAPSGYIGMLQPGSELIKQRWEQELALPLAPNLTHQLSPPQILPPILQLLLK